MRVVSVNVGMPKTRIWKGRYVSTAIFKEPVLFVTGYSADRLARSGAVGPHDRVLEKPYQLEELTRTIRKMLEARIARARS